MLKHVVGFVVEIPGSKFVCPETAIPALTAYWVRVMELLRHASVVTFPGKAGHIARVVLGEQHQLWCSLFPVGKPSCGYPYRVDRVEQLYSFAHSVGVLPSVCVGTLTSGFLLSGTLGYVLDLKKKILSQSILIRVLLTLKLIVRGACKSAKDFFELGTEV